MSVSMTTSNEEGDQARIWNMDKSDWNKLSRFRPRCCGNSFTVIPIVISTIALFLALGTVFGVAIRWNQMNKELEELRGLASLTGEFRMLKESLQNQPQNSKQVSTPAQGSVAYTRWGKKVCPGDASLVYAGFGAGSSSSSTRVKGGGVQYLCMPPKPEYNKFDMSNDSSAFSWIYGAEYLSYTNYGIFDDEIHGHNVACSVCLAPRSAKVMIPALRTCPIGWTTEYEGYLMTSYVTGNKMTFECIDKDPDVIGGTQNITGGAQLFFVSPYCEDDGGLAHCPPYIGARELTCVVCTQ